MIKQYIRSLEIPNNAIVVDVDFESDLQFTVHGETDDHIVSCDDGIWRCTCEDYQFKKDKHLGSYTCKHILKCIQFLRDRDKSSQKVLEDWL